MIEVLLIPPLLALSVGVLAWLALKGGTLVHTRRVKRARRIGREWAFRIGWTQQVSPDGDITLTHPELPVAVHGRWSQGRLLGHVAAQTGLPMEAHTRLPGQSRSTTAPHTGDMDLERQIDIERMDGLALGALDAELRALLRTCMALESEKGEPYQPHVIAGVLHGRVSVRTAAELLSTTANHLELQRRIPPREDWVAGLRQRVLEDPEEAVRHKAVRHLIDHAEHPDAELEALYEQVEDPYLRGRLAVGLRIPELLLDQLESKHLPGQLLPELMTAFPRPWNDEVLAWMLKRRQAFTLPTLYEELAHREHTETAEVARLLPPLLDGPLAGDALRVLGEHGTLDIVEALHERQNGKPRLSSAVRRNISETIARIQQRAGPADAGAVSLAMEDLQLGAVSLAERSAGRREFEPS